MLNELLQFEVKDPRLQDVRVTQVEVSGDLGVARVFYSCLDPDADPEPAREALLRAAAFMRTRIGKGLRLRRVPELRFEVDLSTREGFRISRLIDESTSPGGDEDPADV